MADDVSVTGAARGGGAARRIFHIGIILVLVCGCLLAACTSAEDLVRILQTEEDAAARQGAAADLARRHSLVATQELAAAAVSDPIASAGLGSLVDEYVLFFDAEVAKAAGAGEELDDETTLALQETIDCMAAIEDQKAVEGLGALIYPDGGVPPDTQALRRSALDALARMGSEAAIRKLVALVSHAPSQPQQATETRSAIQNVLEDIGEPAVGALMEVLAEQSWAADSLVTIGSPAVPRLVQRIESAEASARYGALEVLLRLYVAQDVVAMSTLLSDGDLIPVLIEARSEASYDGSLQGTVEEILWQIGEPAVGPLMDIAEETDWAYEILIDQAAAVPALIERLGSQPWVEQALVDIGRPAVQPVRDQIGAADELTRHRCIGVLLRMYDNYDTAVDRVLLDASMVPWLLADLQSQAYAVEYASPSEDGFDRQWSAQLALAEIGEPAVAPLLGSEYEWRWFVLSVMGTEAVPDLLAVMTGDEREDALNAAVSLAMMNEYEPAAVGELTAALADDDLEAVAANYLFYIALGEEGSEEVIGRALQAHGKKQMALDCLNCGNESLDAAARKWARNHGYRVYTSSEPEMALPWGSGM